MGPYFSKEQSAIGCQKTGKWVGVLRPLFSWENTGAVMELTEYSIGTRYFKYWV